jgi:hypothetical protein
MGYAVLDLASACRAAELCERGHAPVGDAARNDELKIFEPSVDVERKTVARDPSGDANADGTNFLDINPRAGHPFDTMRGDAVIGADANHHLFEIANVSMDVASIGT